ncbi:MAG: DUF1361 domain-containing protein [Bacteroidota bacterium]
MTALFNNGKPTSKSYVLILGMVLSIGLWYTRTKITGEGTFGFLLWNLFLAWVPLLLSTILTTKKRAQKWYFVLPILSVWILFLPNAPYILTDLFHLKQRSMPLWFDLVMLLSFAWNGLLFGLISLQQVEQFIKEKTNKYFAFFTSGVVLFACAFGIYLGRYLRFNSWDVLRSPETIVFDSLELILNAQAHPGGIGMTIAYGAFFLFVYLSMKTNGKMSGHV